MPHPEGKPEPIPGSDALLCDSVAYLSGVNYGSVVKVLSALNAISDYALLPIGEALDVDNIHPDPVTPSNPDTHLRVRNTDIFVRALVQAGFASKYPALAKPTAKFLPSSEALKVGLTD